MLQVNPDLEYLGYSTFADCQTSKPGGACLLLLMLLCHQNETYCIYRYGMETFMTDKKIQRPLFEMIARWFSLHTHRAALHDPVHVGAFAGSYLERQMWDHQ